MVCHNKNEIFVSDAFERRKCWLEILKVYRYLRQQLWGSAFRNRINKIYLECAENVKAKPAVNGSGFINHSNVDPEKLLAEEKFSCHKTFVDNYKKMSTPGPVP